MNNKSVLIILAAGIGSRMKEITDKTSKCIVDLGSITPLEYTISEFSKNGIKDFIIITGHFSNQIIEKLGTSRYCEGSNLTFIQNNYYKKYGCEYSLSLSWRHIVDYDTIYIAEGDSIFHPDYIKSMIHSEYDSSVLARPSKFIRNDKSVVLASTDSDENIGRFVYDPSHLNVYDQVEYNEHIIGESMQLWKYSGKAKVLLNGLLGIYSCKCVKYEEDINYCHESGLYCINELLDLYEKSHAVFVEGTNWLNLNTIKDVEEGRSLEWLTRK